VSADHFYTTSTTERDNAVVTYGYHYEGVACYVFNSKVPGTTEFWRLYNPQTGYHFYTASSDEKNIDLTSGWVVEPDSPVACYVFNSKAPGTTEFWRLYNPQTGDHFFTTSTKERDNAENSFGYVVEPDSPVACYVFDSQAPGTTPLYRLLRAPSLQRTEPAQQSGVYQAYNGVSLLVTQGLTGCTLIAGKRCLFRLFMPPQSLSQVDTAIFELSSSVLYRPATIVVSKPELITESTVPNGPSVGGVIGGAAFPKAGTYTIALSVQDSSSHVLRQTSFDLTILPTKDLRLLIVFGEYLGTPPPPPATGVPPGPYAPTAGWYADIARSMDRIASIFPVRDGVQNDLNGNTSSGLRYLIGEPCDASPVATVQYLDCVYEQTRKINASGGDKVDVTVESRPGLYAPEWNPPGDLGPGGNSGRPAAPYSDLPRASMVGGLWNGIEMTAAGVAQEIGHNFGLEPPTSPHYQDPADPGHSKDPFIYDQFAYDFINNRVYDPQIGDTMNNLGGGAFQGVDHVAFNAYDWEYLRSKLLELDSTGTG
jgi:Repeat of unknown function (DUF5648)